MYMCIILTNPKYTYCLIITKETCYIKNNKIKNYCRNLYPISTLSFSPRGNHYSYF